MIAEGGTYTKDRSFIIDNILCNLNKDKSRSYNDGGGCSCDREREEGKISGRGGIGLSIVAVVEGVHDGGVKEVLLSAKTVVELEVVRVNRCSFGCACELRYLSVIED